MVKYFLILQLNWNDIFTLKNKKSLNFGQIDHCQTMMGEKSAQSAAHRIRLGVEQNKQDQKSIF